MTLSTAGYDPHYGVDEKAATHIVVVIRDPDASNEYRAWSKAGTMGLLYAVDIDAGADDLTDPDTYADWAEGLLNRADRLTDSGWREAAEYIRSTVQNYNPEGD